MSDLQSAVQSAVQSVVQLAVRSAVQLAVQSAVQSVVPSANCRSNMYIQVYHTNRRSIKNAVGMVLNCPVGMGLYTSLLYCQDQLVN